MTTFAVFDCFAVLADHLHIVCTVRSNTARGLLQQAWLRSIACLQITDTSMCASQYTAAEPCH